MKELKTLGTSWLPFLLSAASPNNPTLSRSSTRAKGRAALSSSYLPTAILLLGSLVAPSPAQYPPTNNPTLSGRSTVPKGRATPNPTPKLFNISNSYSTPKIATARKPTRCPISCLC